MIRIAQVEDIPAIYEIYCFYVEHGEALFDLRPQPFEAFQRMWKQSGVYASSLRLRRAAV